MPLSIELAKTTFAAGEVSPELYARDDLAKAQTGCRALENMVVLLEGGVTRRPGTRMIIAAKDPTQAQLGIPFRFSPTDKAMLVLNAGVMRVIINNSVQLAGGLPYELAIPYAAADLPNIRYARSGNLIYLACTGKQPQQLQRQADNTWTITPYQQTGGPVDPPNTTATTIGLQNSLGGALDQSSATPGNTCKLVASAPVFTVGAAGSIGGVWRFDESAPAAIAEWTANTTFGASTIARWNGNTYLLTGANTNSGPNPPVHTAGSVLTGQGFATWAFVARDRGFVRITAVTDTTHATGTILETIPVSCWGAVGQIWWPSSWDGVLGWPDKVALLNNTIVWGRGSKFWRTQPGSFNYFDFALDPTNPQTALAGSLLAPDGALVNIEWMIAAGILVIGSHEIEWIVRGVSIFDALTPTNMQPWPDKQEGSCAHIPAVAEGGVVFIGRSRDRLHHALFDPLLQRLSEQELTITARHILKAKAAWVAHARDPNRVNWIACQDGSLVGNTLMMAQQVNGWHRHPMPGSPGPSCIVECVASLGTSDEGSTQTYLFTQRTINGATARFVELMQPYFTPVDPTAPDARGAWFVDCGLQYTGAPVTVVTGLDHLNGQAVNVHADGAQYFSAGGALPVVGPVTGGIGLKLTRPTTNCIVGLPIPYRFRSLPLDISTPKGTTQGARAKANHFIVHVVNSAGGNIAGNPDAGGKPEPLDGTGALSYGVAVPLINRPIRTGGLLVPLDDQCVVEISGSDTFPFTLTGIDPDVEVTEQD